MSIDSQDKPLVALGVALIASTVVLAVAYPVAKSLTSDAAVAFVIAMLLSILALKRTFSVMSERGMS